MAVSVRTLGKWLLGIILTAAIASLAIYGLTERLPSVDADDINLADHPSFRSWEEHDEIYRRGEFPYAIELADTDGAILYIGVRHSTDPEDNQWNALRLAWQEFAPTVALNEGRSRYFRWPNAALGGISDPKLTYMLARQDGIPTYSLEPTYQVEVDALLQSWPAELIASYLALRVITSEPGGDARRAESIATGLIAKRTNVDGLRGVLTGVEDLDAVWAEHVSTDRDWRTLTNVDSIPLLRQIGDDSREVRGRHMVRSLVSLARRGERVVAVVGASHVIRHEPTLRSLFEGP